MSTTAEMASLLFNRIEFQRLSLPTEFMIGERMTRRVYQTGFVQVLCTTVWLEECDVFNHTIERITPPSTRNAAPFTAEDNGLAMYFTREATSSVEAKRLSNELGRMVAKNSFSM